MNPTTHRVSPNGDRCPHTGPKKLSPNGFESFFSLGPHLQHKEGPRLWVKSELQPPIYATATAKWDPSHICGLHHTSWQCQILNPLNEARDQMYIPMNTSQVLNPLSQSGNSQGAIFKVLFREKMAELFWGKISPVVILQDDLCLILQDHN